MYHYSFKPHRADIRLKVKARSRIDIFTGALEGMVDLLGSPGHSDGKSKSRSFNIIADDDVSLLVDFLNEVLARICIDKVLYHIKEIALMPDYSIGGIICGSRVKKFQREIKAATFHEAYFRESSDGIWEAMVIFDI